MSSQNKEENILQQDLEIRNGDSGKTDYHINFDKLINRTKSNPNLMKQMIALYLEQTPPLLQAMLQSLKEKNWPRLQSSVHKMIPSFSIMGIDPQAEEIARKIESYEKIHQNESIEELVTQLEMICTQACHELEEKITTIKSS